MSVSFGDDLQMLSSSDKIMMKDKLKYLSQQGLHRQSYKQSITSRAGKA